MEAKTAPVPTAVTTAPTLDAMRTLVGVDGEDLYIPALQLLGRLRFAGNRVTLAHAEPGVGVQLSPTPMVYEYRDQAELEARLRLRGEALLDQAAQAAARAGLAEDLKKLYEIGSSSSTLMRLADETRADLVAIGAGHHGPMESFFLGSVGRALAIGSRQSFLVGRNVSKETGKLHVVFATDHSDYADRCMHRLLDMESQGIGRITLVTATDLKFETKVARELGLDTTTPYALSEAETKMRECGNRKAARWRERGIEAEYRLVEGHPADVVRATMRDTGADLLALGARGHGVVERVLIGSLALHQVVAETYSTLVLRMPGEE